MTADEKYIDIQTGHGPDTLILRGDWTIDNSAVIGKALSDAATGQVGQIDASQIGRMDTWGSVRLKDLASRSTAPPILNETQKRIFDFLPDEFAQPEKRPSSSLIFNFFDAIGRWASHFYATIFGLMSFIGEIFICFARNIAHPRSFRFHAIVRHIDETGFRALPIIGLLAILISMVISYQAATQLAKFGANIFTVDLTVLSLLREMAVLITAIMVAGRSGSAFAAEIGVMKLREEVDAMKTMGFDPIEMLVLPRMIALVITLPLLTFLADIIGLIGGAIIAVLLLDIPLDQYTDRVQSVATPMMFFVGLIKAPVFAFVITIVGTYQGMNVTGSAESVGKLTTLSVVQSIFLVIMVDAIFSILFAQLGI